MSHFARKAEILEDMMRVSSRPRWPRLLAGGVLTIGVLAGVIMFRYAAPWAARKWDAAPAPIATGSEAA